MTYNKQTCFILNFIKQRAQFLLTEAENETGYAKHNDLARADELIQLKLDLECELEHEKQENNIHRRQRRNSTPKT